MYVDVSGALGLLEVLLPSRAVVLTGPPGVGKRSAARAYAQKQKRDLRIAVTADEACAALQQPGLVLVHEPTQFDMAGQVRLAGRLAGRLAAVVMVVTESPQGNVSLLYPELLSCVDVGVVGYPSAADELTLVRTALDDAAWLHEPVSDGVSLLASWLAYAVLTRTMQREDARVHALSPGELIAALQLVPTLQAGQTLALTLGKQGEARGRVLAELKRVQPALYTLLPQDFRA